jgi:hypothetical protein
VGFGLKYTKGLQPFIKYINSVGELKEEKNQSLQLFLRFRIWRSGTGLRNQ